ncbi:HAD-IIB family hydrolase [uncultured Umboniibacter sp.]|uniref:HAD-IIB family hydrolase n=1 Tax=uncultured Umboniibacter sp. TaxID=1798917 RepID=UPI002630A663|nr:HAD-IIB family hydrolase [uncultured Umboniibacter sp.]
MSFIVFSDLDGTLLDHHDYSFDAALASIAALQAQAIPLVLNTSKTEAETTEIRTALRLEDAFIIENGAAAYLPKRQFLAAPAESYAVGDYWCHALVEPVEYWRKLLTQFAGAHPQCFTTFSEMSVTQLSDLTGLTMDQARSAKSRAYGEVLHWIGTDSSLNAFRSFAKDNGAKVHIGGRFVHFGGDTDKGRAMEWVTARYQELKSSALQTIALGDGGNDAPMLEVADFPIVIRSPVNPSPNLTTTAAVRTSKSCGPLGWQEEIARFLQIEPDTKGK